MRAHRLYGALALIFIPTLAHPADTEWRRYAIPSTRTSVEMPVTMWALLGLFMVAINCWGLAPMVPW